MPGETILIVEDVPESLKFAAGVLRGAGYKVQIASTAEQALSTLRFLQPQMVLVDFVLPGMNGLELTAKIKREERLQNTIVVALTGCALPDDETRALEAGCDAYLTKPISGRELVARINEILDSGHQASQREAAKQPSREPLRGLPEEELAELRDSFLKAGKALSRQILSSLEDDFDEAKTLRTVHQWVGTAGLLDFPNVAYRARDVDVALRTPPWTATGLRGPLTNLARSFYDPTVAASDPPSQAAVRALAGMRVALIGLTGDEADLMCGALEGVNARPMLFDADQSPYGDTVSICHLVVVHVGSGNMLSRWLADEVPGVPAIPTLHMGTPEDLLALDTKIQSRASGLLTSGCQKEEALMRLRLAVTEKPQPLSPGSGTGLVLADSDSSGRAKLQKRLEEALGMPCRIADSGPETIVLLREMRPRVAAVDVGMDGFEVMAAIRAEALPVQTIFLTYEAHEDEILRGFSLGAGDYLAQPYHPLELAARVKRLAG